MNYLTFFDTTIHQIVKKRSCIFSIILTKNLTWINNISRVECWQSRLKKITGVYGTCEIQWNHLHRMFYWLLVDFYTEIWFLLVEQSNINTQISITIFPINETVVEGTFYILFWYFSLNPGVTLKKLRKAKMSFFRSTN